MNIKVFKEQLYKPYYAILLVIMFILMRPNVNIPTIIRIVMLVLTFVPVIFNIKLLPFVFLCFYGTSAASFSPVIPTMPIYYIFFITLFYLFYNRKSMFFIKSLTIYAYFFLCSFMHFDILDIFIWIFICIILGDMIKEEKDLEMLFYGFLIISLFLSLLYIVNRNEFLYEYGKASLGLEHSGWINPNVFGAYISAGGVLSCSYLTNYLTFKRSRILIIICSIVTILSFLVLSLNSSRGSIFSFTIPILFMILTSKIKLFPKIFIITIIIVVGIIMFNNNLFDLLLHRLQDDTLETGGGRSTIWALKLESFINDSNLLALLFGVGKTGTFNIGDINISTHNDIVTSFIGFGIIGFILFVYFIILYPTIIANKSKKLFISIISIYTFIECMVLEPFFRGYVIVIMFYIFTVKYSIIQKNSQKI